MIFLLRRLGFYFAAFMVAITLNFLLPRLMPGDPTTRIFASLRGKLRPEQLDVLREAYGLDGSLLDQYLNYLWALLHLDFGISTVHYPEPTADLLFYAAGWTLFLVGVAIALSFAIGILMGIYSAWHRGGFFDSVFTPINVMMNAFTPAVVALLLWYAFTMQWTIFPLGRAHDINLTPGWNLASAGNIAWHAVLPVLSIVLVNFGSWHLGMRNTMINLLNEDFVVLARAKGLSDRRIRNRYVARNAILPQITSLALSVGYVFGGAFIAEVVFNYPGLGKFTLNAIESRDYTFIQAQLTLLTCSVLVANLISDVCNVVLDPRLRRAGGH
ncbi:MAG: ABC transporter permease [Candidatus Devosia phytovorans]|uniref:ABC transporter permease n=1 Tax=Candidatus Devosia phytovorans TaxID=3121372 RepID=A0AAJ5VRZ5_9HYPH|nr:ABC transporter permease [Devosia sp.]WEK03614.1 MAG: ABC transporter permease [Devosia sp.]